MNHGRGNQRSGFYQSSRIPVNDPHSSSLRSGFDQGSRVQVNVPHSSSLRSSGDGNLMPRPDYGLADWQLNNRVPLPSFGQLSNARSGTQTGIPHFEESLLERRNTSTDTRFPSELHPSMQIVLFDSMARREPRPRMEPFRRELSRRFPVQQLNSLNIQSREDSAKMEQENALKMLKKVTYGSDPKTLTRRLSLFYNGAAGSSKATMSGSNKIPIDEDSKRCAICLEDFEVGTEVMVTPCNHMFHEECILPWMKSHGQCPVCRFVISEKIKANAAALSNASATPLMPLFDDLFTIEDLPLNVRPRHGYSSFDVLLSHFWATS